MAGNRLQLERLECPGEDQQMCGLQYARCHRQCSAVWKAADKAPCTWEVGNPEVACLPAKAACPDDLLGREVGPEVGVVLKHQPACINGAG